ncbi:hypothetical protein LDENG_00072790 [Lucifuga dentata]|nr:hypothetical protein LDENG_00072790 [Lucifuga dentata]
MSHYSVKDNKEIQIRRHLLTICVLAARNAALSVLTESNKTVPLRQSGHSSQTLRRQLSGVQMSAHTDRCKLLSYGLKSRCPAKKPLWSKKNISDRLIFCRKYKKWTAAEWGKVIFSDESPFSCFGNQGSIRVRRWDGERCEME